MKISELSKKLQCLLVGHDYVSSNFLTSDDVYRAFASNDLSCFSKWPYYECLRCRHVYPNPIGVSTVETTSSTYQPEKEYNPK